ncbi:fimbria/pilus chaperone family protein [Dyella sp. M7H15-1]|uniref:fimbria/pilus chaperone family protein n=1 Tax=Dyella sp. M7H15-1 TaxID=2501295 RepID=UPI0013E8D990|nr:fimbria/pilus chaperone family protein [Dyella sp. M7H15-1]
MSLPQLVVATSFRLQTITVVLDERDGRTDFNVTNTGSEPMLLLTKLQDVDSTPMSANILVTPAVTRIDPGQSQLVHFMLKKGVKLEREYLLKASFEGVTQRADKGARMTVRQQVGFILQPKSVPVEERPWKDLRVQVNGDSLILTNAGRHIVRLMPSIALQPKGVDLPLEHPYILPGQRVSAAGAAVGGTTQIAITPLSRYGFAQAKAELTVAP